MKTVVYSTCHGVGASYPAGGPDFKIEVFPIPSSSEVFVEFNLPKSDLIELGIYIISGQLIQVLSHGAHQTGSYRYSWNGRSRSGDKVDAGTYIYMLRGANGITSGKILLMD